MLLKENAVNLGNTEMQILTRPVPATTVIARLSEILRAFFVILNQAFLHTSGKPSGNT